MTTDSNITHVFEIAGLGAAPFTFLGIEDSAAKVNTDDGMVRTTGADGFDYYTKPGGSCDFCGTYIVIFCWIRDAKGKRFKVGTSCASKTDDKGIVDKAKRAANKLKRTKQVAREQVRIDAARAAFVNDLKGVRAWLASFPHPHEYRAEKGATWADCVEWSLVDSGRAHVERVYSTGDSAPEWLADESKKIPGAGHKGQMEMTRLIERVLKGKQDAPVWAWQKRKAAKEAQA